MKYIALIIILLAVSCKTSEKTETAHKEKLSVSFFSRGSGIDYKKRAELDQYLSDFEKAEHVKLTVEQLKWGREGEVDYCIDLKAVCGGKKNKLIGGIKKVAGNSVLIRTTETDICTHAGQNK